MDTLLHWWTIASLALLLVSCPMVFFEKTIDAALRLLTLGTASLMVECIVVAAIALVVIV